MALTLANKATYSILKAKVTTISATQQRTLLDLANLFVVLQDQQNRTEAIFYYSMQHYSSINA